MRASAGYGHYSPALDVPRRIARERVPTTPYARTTPTRALSRVVLNFNETRKKKFSIRGQKTIAIRKSNISLPRLLRSDWKCAHILIA